MDLQTYYSHLKFCPECGKELEQSPIEYVYACFLHGDFRIVDGRIVWDYTKNLIKREG